MRLSNEVVVENALDDLDHSWEWFEVLWNGLEDGVALLGPWWMEGGQFFDDFGMFLSEHIVQYTILQRRWNEHGLLCLGWLLATTSFMYILQDGKKSFASFLARYDLVSSIEIRNERWGRGDVSIISSTGERGRRAM